MPTESTESTASTEPTGGERTDTVSRAPATFRQSDLTRAIRAAVKAGVRVTGATVDAEGKISLTIGGEQPVQQTDLDRWLGKWGRSHADAT